MNRSPFLEDYAPSAVRVRVLQWTIALLVLLLLAIGLLGALVFREVAGAAEKAHQELVVDSTWDLELQDRVIRLVLPMQQADPLLRPLFQEPETDRAKAMWVHYGAYAIHDRLTHRPRTPGLDQEVFALTRQAIALSDLTNIPGAGLRHMWAESYSLAPALRYQQRLSRAVSLLEEASYLIDQDEIHRSNPTPTNSGETP